ncbi:MAG: hypothetical protein WA736_11730, partial [Candidatus Acidiferrum sp.]
FVPAEIVAAGEEAMGFGEVHEEIGLGEIETVLCGMRGAPFHLVFGDEDGALVEEKSGEFGAMELGVGDRGAEVESFGMGEFAELGDLGGLLRGGKSRSGEGRESELEEITAAHGWSVGVEL